MKVILASQSPRRKELLRLIVETFEIVPANIDEQVQQDELPKVYVQRMAREKAQAIVTNYPEDLVIASDTIVVNEGKILGKPVSRLEAQEMLVGMSGKTHQVYTSVFIQSPQKQKELIASAAVTFFELTEAEIFSYLNQGEYADKAGAYGIQGAAAVFVKEVQGDFYSIVGFPVGQVNQLLKEFTY